MLRKKKRAENGRQKVLVLGDHSIPAKHIQLLEQGPKFALEVSPTPVDKLAYCRSLTKSVAEELRPSCSSECLDVISCTKN